MITQTATIESIIANISANTKNDDWLTLVETRITALGLGLLHEYGHRPIALAPNKEEHLVSQLTEIVKLVTNPSIANDKNAIKEILTAVNNYDENCLLILLHTIIANQDINISANLLLEAVKYVYAQDTLTYIHPLAIHLIIPKLLTHPNIRANKLAITTIFNLVKDDCDAEILCEFMKNDYTDPKIILTALKQPKLDWAVFKAALKNTHISSDQQAIASILALCTKYDSPFFSGNDTPNSVKLDDVLYIIVSNEHADFTTIVNVITAQWVGYYRGNDILTTALNHVNIKNRRAEFWQAIMRRPEWLSLKMLKAIIDNRDIDNISYPAIVRMMEQLTLVMKWREDKNIADDFARIIAVLRHPDADQDLFDLAIKLCHNQAAQCNEDQLIAKLMEQSQQLSPQILAAIVKSDYVNQAIITKILYQPNATSLMARYAVAHVISPATAALSFNVILNQIDHHNAINDQGAVANDCRQCLMAFVTIIEYDCHIDKINLVKRLLAHFDFKAAISQILAHSNNQDEAIFETIIKVMRYTNIIDDELLQAQHNLAAIIQLQPSSNVLKLIAQQQILNDELFYGILLSEHMSNEVFDQLINNRTLSLEHQTIVLMIQNQMRNNKNETYHSIGIKHAMLKITAMQNTIKNWQQTHEQLTTSLELQQAQQQLPNQKVGIVSADPNLQSCRQQFATAVKILQRIQDSQNIVDDFKNEYQENYSITQ